ncbi:hypothetical protein AHF37_12786 [Paragonimus kellicotti]|nr:hypothetical protein AHF37_12786 [Paragonimus kellicotti]
MRAYTDCLELASGCPDHLAVAYRNRALVALQMGKNEMAVEDCTQALRHEPLNAVAHYRRALGRRVRPTDLFLEVEIQFLVIL